MSSKRSRDRRRGGGKSGGKSGNGPRPTRESGDKSDASSSQASPPEPVADEYELPRWKLGLFSVATTVGFFVLLEVTLALLGVRPILHSDDPYVGFASNIPLFVEERGADDQIFMVTAPNKTTWFNPQRFQRDKPDGTFRIFSLGGSTTYGRPYDDKVSFSGWLRELLPVADPSREWEVINAGGISYASYRVALVMEELVQYAPDLFIIYSGHNEFLERRTYQSLVEAPKALTTAQGWLSRTRIYGAGAELVASVSGRQTELSTQRAMLGGEVDTILDHSIGPSAYTRDDTQRNQTLAHYRFNLVRMIDIARAAGAEVVLVTPTSNLKDCSPFKSEHLKDRDADQTERFDSLYEEARRAQASGRLDDALDAFAKAAAIDDRYAGLHYLRGLVLYELGRYVEAKAALLRSLEEDVCPLRAPEAVRQIVSQVAAARGIPLLDFAGTIEQRSDHGIPDASYFLDHVHLSVDGYRLLALQLIDTLARVRVVSIADGWNDAAVQTVAHRVESRIDKQEHGIALRNMAKVYNWAGKLEESERLAAQANELLGEDAESFAILGLRAAERGEAETAIRQFRRALELEPGYAEAHFGLALQLMSEGKLGEAEDHFRRALRLKPGYGVAHGGLGMALASQGNLDEAIKHYREALRILPDYAEPHHGLGLVLVAKGRHAEAIRHFEEALRVNPNYTEAHNNLGNALASMGRLHEAVSHLRKALMLDPNYVEAHRNIGLVLGSQGMLNEAMSHFSEVLRISPGDAEVHYLVADALETTGHTGRALPHFREAIRLEPDRPAFLSHLAWVLSTDSDPELRGGSEAVRLAERAAKMTRYQNPVILDTLAAAYAETGQFEQAVQAAERGLAICSKTGEHDLGGRVRQRLGLYRQARPYREPPRPQV
jgi:tetratricopeptide (TPR) repeat protein